MDLVALDPTGDVLATHRVVGNVRHRHRLHRPQDFELLVPEIGGHEFNGRLHGEHRHQLQGVVLHDVPQGAGLVVELAASLDADRLRHRDLHRVDVAPVPDRLEEAIPEPEDGQVLDCLLPQVVVDAVDLGFAEDFADLAVQLSSGADVGAERLLDDDPNPATLGVTPFFARLRQPRSPQLLDDLRVEDGRDGEVDEAIPRGAAIAVDAVEPLDEVRVRAGVAEITGVILDSAAKRLPDRWLHRPVAAVLVDPLPQQLAELVVRDRPPGEPDHRELRREEAAKHQVVERRSQLANGQVAGRPADDHGARLGDSLQAQPLAQRVGNLSRSVTSGNLVGEDGDDRRAGWRQLCGPQSPERPAAVVAAGSAAAPSPPAPTMACPPNSLRSAASTRSVNESGSRRLRKRCIRERVMIGAGTLWSMASRTVQRPSPESATQPLICSRSEPSRLKASAASSISHERITLPWFQSSAMAARSSSKSDACMMSKPSPMACITPYSIPLWTILT